MGTDSMVSLLQRFKERKLFQWALAYLAGAWLVFQGIEVLAEPWHVSEAIQRSLHVLLGIGFLGTVVLAWYHGEKGRQRVSGVELLILTGILVIAGAAVAVLGREDVVGRQPIQGQGSPVSDVIEPMSIAVLPFTNLSADPDNEYFSDGITSDISDRLGSVADLRVTARTSAVQYRETEKPIQQIGRELAVANIVTGEVQRSGGRLRVSARLIAAGNGQQLWSNRYDRELATGHIFVIQSEVAQHIVSALQATLAPGDERRLFREPTGSLLAYEYMQRGTYRLHRGFQESRSQAIALFDSAIAVDPDYAEAYVGVAKAWLDSATLSPYPPPLEAIEASRSAALRALELDSMVTGAHAVLANIASWIDWDWSGAASHVRRALELTANDADARLAYADLLLAFGLRDEAVDQCRTAVALDPLNGAHLQFCAMNLALAGYSDEGLTLARRAVELDERNRVVLAVMYDKLHRYEEALAEYLAGDSLMGLSTAEERRQTRAAFSEEGWPGVLRLWLSDAEDAENPQPTWVAFLYAELGESEEALNWLERALEWRDSAVTVFLYGPAFIKLHDHPRGQALLEELGLSEGRIQGLLERLGSGKADS
jgi:TolB-like protein/tetratricopeptide (TPR) repeat protein